VTWQRQKRAIVERRPEFDGLHVVGIENRRQCGCAGFIGMRMDKREVTFSAVACDEHGAQVARAMDALRHMPPQEREVADLFAEILDRELEVVEGFR
jgi:hypothetical protein